MTRTWKLLGLQAVVALALTAPRLGAVEEGLKTDSEKLDAALQKLTQIQKSLDELEKLRRDLRGDTNVTVQKTLEDVSGLKTQVAQIRRDLEELRGRLGPTTRTAGYPPDGAGRVMLVNEYPTEMEVIVNQTSYRVAPNMTREVALPAGTFTFRVPNAAGFEAPQSRVLPPNHNYRITIHP